jgi:hypothetical protein
MEKDYAQSDKHLTAHFNQNLKNKKEKIRKVDTRRQGNKRGGGNYQN